MTEDFSGRTALVTGGARGLGYAMAAALGAHGADLVLVDLLDGVGDSAARLDADVSGRVVGLTCDVTDADQVRDTFDLAAGEVGEPSILVNAAGIAWNEPALTVSVEKWRQVLDVNVTGTFLPCRELGRRLSEAGERGAIVNIASMSGMIVNVPQPQAAYNASKAAVAMLTASLAVEWRPLGIRVNAIAPGYFASDMTKSAAAAEPEMVEEWLHRTPAGRMGQPDELGPLVCYLCGDGADFMVGQTVVLDGGYTIV